MPKLNAFDREEKHLARTQELVKTSLNDLFFFNQYILGNGGVMNERLHKEMCDFVTSYRDWKDAKKKKLILEPRGTLKSTCVTIAYPLQLILKEPNVRILIDSEKQTNSKAFLSAIQGIIETNEKYRNLSEYLYGKCPNPRTNKEEKWTSTEIVSALRTDRSIKEPTISCAGVDVVKVGMHYDVIIMDDPVSDNNTGTKEQIDKVIQHYKLSLSLLEPGGKLIIIGTRWNFGDLYGYLIENAHQYFNILIRKATLDGTTNFEESNLLYPEKLTKEFLDEVRYSQGNYHFSCQYFNTPVPQEDAVFKWTDMREWSGEYENGLLRMTEARRYTGENTTEVVEQATTKPVNVYMTVDPALSMAVTADFTAIVVTAMDNENKLYVLDYVNKRLAGQKFWDEIFAMYAKYQPRRWGLEVTAFQKSLAINLNEEMRRRNTFIRRPDELKAVGSKEERIALLQPRFESGSLFIKRGMDDLKNQMVSFPRATHDDLIDALSYTLQIASPKKQRHFYKSAYQPLYSSTGY